MDTDHSDGARSSLLQDADDAVARALLLGNQMMNSMRESNAEYEKRTGEPSRIIDADYVRGENDIAIVALKYWGFDPIKAKRMVQAYREKLAS